MQFKKVDVLISENLTKEQLKEKVLTELNKISKESNPSISYIANIHDIVNGKYWICMDSETKETMGAEDELIDLQAIFRHTTENPEEASKDLLYSSKYIEDNFLRKIVFETYKESNDTRLTKLETTVDTNEKDIEDKHYKLEKRVTTAENTITDNRKLEDTRYNEYTQFKKDTENNILSINNTLKTKADLGGSETQVFNVADPTSDWHAVNLAYAKKNFNIENANTHMADTNNPHKTSIANLIDTSIVSPTNNHILQYDSSTKKWKNTVLSVDLSNYYNKSEVDTKLDTKANSNSVYTKTEINTKFNSYYNSATVDSFMELKANAESVYTKTEIDAKLKDIDVDVANLMAPKYLKFKVCRFKINNWYGSIYSYAGSSSGSPSDYGLTSVVFDGEPKNDKFSRFVKVYDGKLFTGGYYNAENAGVKNIIVSPLVSTESSETQIQLRFDIPSPSYTIANPSYMILVIAESDYDAIKDNIQWLEEIDAIPGYDYDDKYPIPQS